MLALAPTWNQLIADSYDAGQSLQFFLAMPRIKPRQGDIEDRPWPKLNTHSSLLTQ